MKHRKKDEFLDQIKKIPNISLSCEKLGLSRNTIYRWSKEDSKFKTRLDEAIDCGIESVNDLAESKLIANINRGDMRAIQYWLDNNKKNYMRPRPKSFWDMIYPNPITEIKITPFVPHKEQEKKTDKR